MSAAQRFLVLVHGVLALGFGGYTLLVVRLYLEDASNGHISEGAKYGIILGTITAACLLLVVAGVGLWARTGKRRFLLGVDLFVGALSWTVLLAFMFAGPLLFVAFLGVTLLAPLVAIVVPPPQRSDAVSHGH
jgi:hypothetical protein